MDKKLMLMLVTVIALGGTVMAAQAPVGAMNLDKHHHKRHWAPPPPPPPAPAPWGQCAPQPQPAPMPGPGRYR